VSAQSRSIFWLASADVASLPSQEIRRCHTAIVDASLDPVRAGNSVRAATSRAAASWHAVRGSAHASVIDLAVVSCSRRAIDRSAEPKLH
jgi:hypothetical protein